MDLELDDYADNGLPGIDYDVAGIGGGVAPWLLNSQDGSVTNSLSTYTFQRTEHCHC